jgi:hypothetical protein
MKKRTILTLVLLALVVLALVPSAGAWSSNHWVSPTRNIACKYLPIGRGFSLVGCVTRNDSWGVFLTDAGGRALVKRGGMDLRKWNFYSPALSYGAEWSNDAQTLTCVSRFSGMSCYHGRHGFFISRLEYRVW